jgi:DNA-binding XRE family transcriptional regulator
MAFMVNAGGQKMAQYRVSTRLTMALAAAKIGVTRQCWYDWQRGARRPSEKNMLALCALIPNLTPNDFYALSAAPAAGGPASAHLLMIQAFVAGAGLSQAPAFERHAA